MLYSEEIAKLLADQVSRIATCNRHQLAGHFANLDFWLSEVAHVLTVIDGYHARFKKLKAAETEYVKHNHTIAFTLGRPDDTPMSIAMPRRASSADLRSVRQSATDACYHLLVRCYKERLLSEPELRETCKALNIGVDPHDLKIRR